MAGALHFARFGEFEVDLDQGLVTKNGRPVRLQNQPFVVLSLLLERPGEIVTREQLRAALWSSDTFVNFDRSLNATIAKLRHALGDSGDHSIYIETVAKRGYRFIAPVGSRASGGWSVAAEQPPIASPGPAALLPRGARRASSRWWSFGLLGVAAITGFFFWNRESETAPEAKLTQLTSDTGLTLDPAVSADGKWLAYASDRRGHQLHLWIQSLKPGSRARQLTYGEDEARHPSFSKDGSHLAFSCSSASGSGICVMPSLGGAITRLVERGTAPRFSPDGKWIAYQFGQNLTSAVTGYAMGKCYVVPATGGVPQQIAADIRLTSNPVWAPDSEHLLVHKHTVIIADRDWYLVSRKGGPSKRTGLFGVLAKYGLGRDANHIPRLSQWTREHLIFSAAYGDGSNIWRIPVSSEAAAQGKPQRLTLGTAVEVSASSSDNGDLFFGSITQSDAIWSVPLDAEHGVARGELAPLTQGPFDVLPSITADGRQLAFSSARDRSAFSHNAQTRLLDLQSKEETVFSEPGVETEPHISSDGTLIAADETSPTGVDGVKGTRVFRIEDGMSREVPNTATSWAFSHDDRRLLVSNDYHDVRAVDLRSGVEVFRFVHPGRTLYQPSFAPDDGFIVVESQASALQDSRLFIVPIHLDVPEKADQWIAIDHRSLWDDKPRWSPGGTFLYFLSDRDGWLCLWGQRLLPDSKRPVGEPVAVLHFHNSRLDLRNEGFAMLEIGISRDKAVFGIGELRGNIWSIRQSR